MMFATKPLKRGVVFVVAHRALGAGVDDVEAGGRMVNGVEGDHDRFVTVRELRGLRLRVVQVDEAGARDAPVRADDRLHADGTRHVDDGVQLGGRARDAERRGNRRVARGQTPDEAGRGSDEGEVGEERARQDCVERVVHTQKHGACNRDRKLTKFAWYHTEMHIPWDDVQVFLAVAEAGSLSRAAAKLHVTQPTVSRRVSELESRLGEPLFVRSVEGAAVTSFGERMLEPARRMAEWGAEVDRAVEQKETAPAGVVRLTAPPGLAFDLVAPFAGSLRSKLPGVQLEVVSTIHYLDLSRREADLALRFAAPLQRDVVTVASLAIEVGVYAAPSYVKTLPRRYGMADVAWIAWAPPFESLAPNTDLAKAIPGFRPVFASDDYLVQLGALMAGVGAMFLGRAPHRFSRAKELVELQLKLPKRTSTLYLVAAKSALAIPRVRAVADLLARELTR
jgi:DNA-binding transcriptional LysR family regulator